MLRPLVWSLAAVALIVFLLLAYFQSAGFASLVARFAEERAGAYLGREIEIGRLTIDVIPLSIEASDVVIGGERDIGPTEQVPFAEIGRVRIEAQVGSIVNPGVTLHRVYVERPIVRVEVDESGRHNAPRRVGRRSATAARRFQLDIGAVEVVDGVLESLDRRYPLELEARNFTATLGGAAGFELTGQARADEVVVGLPKARPYLGSVALLGSYRPGRVEVASATFSASDLEAAVRGRWIWRGERQAWFAIRASADGKLLDRLGYGEKLIQGPFRFRGEFERGEREWLLSGDLSSPEAVVVERRLESLAGRLTVDRTGARYQIQQGTYGSGELGGTVRMGIGADPSVELDLAVTDADVTTLLEDQAIPLDGVSGRATGSFSYQFARSDPRAGNGWADLAIEPGPPDAGLPLGGSAVLSFGDGRLETEAVRLLGEGHLIVATGGYDIPEGRGTFDFDITTQNVEEILELLPLEAAEPALWKPERGRGRVEASLTLEPQAFRVATELELNDVAAPGLAAERLQGRFDADPSGVTDLRLELLRPEAGLIVTGSVPLAEGLEVTPLSIALDAEGWPVAEVEPWLPFALPLTGAFSGAVSIEGELDALAGSARGRVEPATIGTLTASSLDFDFDFSPDEVLFHRADIGLAAGFLRGGGRYDPVRDRFDLSVSSEDLDLGALELAPIGQGRLAGAFDLSGRFRGSLSEPNAELRLSLGQAALDGEPLGESGTGEARISWTEGRLTADGEIPGLLAIAGGGEVEEGRADLLFTVASADVGGLLALVTPQPLVWLDSSARGELSVQGPLSAENLPSLRLELERMEVRPRAAISQAEALRNLEPVVLAFEGGDIELESFYFGTENESSEIFVAGRLGLDPERETDLKVQSSIAAGWFEPWLPEGVTLSEGNLDVIGSIVGGLEAPSFDGVGEFTGGKAVTSGFAATFEELASVLLFYPGQLVVDRVAARVAGGELEGAGTVAWSGDSEIDYRFQFAGKELSFRYPEGWSTRGDADISLSSSPEGRQLSGSFDLDRALYVADVPIELDQMLRTFFERRRVEVVETNELLSTTQLNLAVTARDTLRVRNNLADLRGSADLVLRGSLGRPVVFGSVELDPSGRLVYAGNQYEIERGLLTFANPYRLEPVIDLVARTDLREYDLTLSLSGTPERLNFDFISDPPLAELEVMALMTGGRAADVEFGRGDDSEALGGDTLGAEEFLYGQATSIVANRFNRLFGLDQFRIDPLTSSTGNLSSARVTVGKQLSRDLFATYSYDPTETEEQIFELEWSISRSLVLVLTQNGDGTYAVDAKWEKAF